MIHVFYKITESNQRNLYQQKTGTKYLHLISLTILRGIGQQGGFTTVIKQYVISNTISAPGVVDNKYTFI
jgi:hypothetical protein